MVAKQPTKAEIAAELEQVKEQNAAFRDLLAAINEGKVPYSVDGGKDRERNDLIRDRFSVVRVYAGIASGDDQDARSIRGVADSLRLEWAAPLPFMPRCMKDIEDDTWTCGKDTYPSSCVLAAGHEGRCLSFKQKRERDEAAEVAA